jgi:hypothetical protein
VANDPQWRPRRFRDPSTIAAFVLLFVSVALIVFDGLDEVLWGQQITFGYWPYVLMTAVGFWFFGIRLARFGGKDGE